MHIQATAIADVKILVPPRFEDERGFFSEVFRVDSFQPVSDVVFVQDNHSVSARAGTIRGLHFQIAPNAQGKLVRVTRGRALDVVVDLRRGSPQYGQHVAVELSAQNWRQLWVPVGFAHGFCTLEPDTEVLYKATSTFAPECDRGLAFDDPALGIGWPVGRDEAVMSDRDRRHPRLADLPQAFE